MKMSWPWVVVSWLMAVGILSAQSQELQSRDTYIQDSVSADNGLSSNYYLASCPPLESIVREKTKALLNADITQAAGLLRLQFHDCFVKGCDASILLNGSASEQTAPPNLSIRPLALSLVNEIKAIVEAHCPLTVSCADIVTLASREAISMAGGPFIPFPLGRRDSLTHATVDETLANLPGFNLNTSRLLSAFAAKNLDKFDLVALSGGHTIGIGHCAAFSSRLYPKRDPALDKSFAKRLYKVCPTGTAADSGNTTDLDFRSPNLFDNKYYGNLVAMKGLFTSDETLYTDSRTKDLVLLYSKSNKAFFEQFSKSMIKMSLLNVLTGSNGQIRRQCNVPNRSSPSLTDTILQVTEDEPSYTAI